MQAVGIPSFQNIFELSFEYKNCHFFLKTSIICSSGIPLRYRYNFIVIMLWRSWFCNVISNAGIIRADLASVLLICHF